MNSYPVLGRPFGSPFGNNAVAMFGHSCNYHYLCCSDKPCFTWCYKKPLWWLLYISLSCTYLLHRIYSEGVQDGFEQGCSIGLSDGISTGFTTGFSLAEEVSHCMP